MSVLFAVGDDRIRKEVLDAHDAAVAAALGWIEDHAHWGYRVNGEIWTVDADGVIATAFCQPSSRARDPQIHTHLVIPNRVMVPDGRCLALDARTLKHDQRTVSALYAAGLRAELTSRLGVRWKPVEDVLAEMADAPEGILAGPTCSRPARSSVRVCPRSSRTGRPAPFAAPTPRPKRCCCRSRRSRAGGRTRDA